VTEAALFGEIVGGAVAESRLWSESVRPAAEREELPVFSPLVPDAALALGLETIYEGYLLHHGRARLFAPADPDIALLLGDALLAHGLVRIAERGDAAAVADLAMLLALCSQARADHTDGDGAAWAATAARLGRGGLDAARDALRERRDAEPLLTLAREAAGATAVARALGAHRERVR
jgi:hypothetical protein